MKYQLEINENSLLISGNLGKYEVTNTEGGFFDISVVRDMFVNEIDSDGDEFLVAAGREWSVPAQDLSELNSFITKCEEEMLWNYMLGPVYKVATSEEMLRLDGFEKRFEIGETDKGLYVDVANSKGHNFVDSLFEALRFVMDEDKWWSRPAKDTSAMLKRSCAQITDGGNLKIVAADKVFVVGEKSDGSSYWVNVIEGADRHVYYKTTWKEVLEIIRK